MLAVISAISSAERRQYDHRYTATRRKKALIYVLFAAMLPFIVGLGIGAYRLGRAVGDGGMDGVLTLARWYVPVLIGLYAFVGLTTVGNRLFGFEARDLLLTTVRDRDLVLGLLLADFREQAVGLVGWALLAALAFAVGVGSVTVAVVAPIAMLALTIAALLVGYLLGIGARTAMLRLEIPSTVRSALGGVGTIAVFLLFAGGGMLAGRSGAEVDLLEGGSVSALAPDGPPPVPIGYYADFFFVGTPLAEGFGPAAIASAAVVVGAIPVAVWGIVAFAPPLWRADRPRSGSTATTTADDSPSLEAGERDTGAAETNGKRREWPWLRVPSGYVADAVLRRAIRTPNQSAHLTYYGMVAGFVVMTGLVGDLALATAVGAALAGLGVLLAGAAVSLNPVGDEGSVLGQLVLADYSPATFVRARVLAGCAVGFPLALAGTALLAIESLSVADAATVGAALALLVPASAGIAVGLGTLLPRSEPGRVLDAFEVRTPEKLAMLVHGLLVVVLAGNLVALLLADGDSAIRWGGIAGLAAAAAIAAHGSYRFAVAGIADYGRPRTPDPLYALELATGLAALGLALSISVPDAVGSVLSVSGPAGFALLFVAAYVGWAVPGIAYLLATGRTRAFLDLRLPTGRDLRYLAVGVAASLGVYGFFVAAVSLLEAPVVSHSMTDEIAAGGAPFVALLAALALLVNAPVEEFLFRNIVQKRLEEAIATRGAILATAILFALIHVPTYLAGDPVAIAVTLAPLSVLAVLWGWLYAKTRTLVVPALCHGVYNAAVFVATFLWLG